MKATSTSLMSDHLDVLGVITDRNIVVHSSLAAFGVLEGGLMNLYHLLHKKIGENATLAVPAYRLSSKAEDVFNRWTSPSLNMGALSEFCRHLRGVERTANPLHSHVFCGPLADRFRQDHVRPSFGPGSDFEFFVEQDFRVIYLGCNLENAGTFVFHSQACANTIPYRNWITLSRPCASNPGAQKPESVAFRYYGRNANAPRETRSSLEKRLRDENRIVEDALPYGKSLAFDAAEVHARLQEIFKEDPMACVAKTTIA